MSFWHDTTGLTAQQKLELAAQAERMKNSANVDTTKQWVEMGQMIGQAIASTAKEVGVAVNEFATTPVGKLTTVLIIWEIAGRDLLHFIIGGLFLAVALSLWIYLYRRSFIIKQVEYGVGWWIFRAKKYVFREEKEINGDFRFGMISILIGILAVSQLIMWTGK